MLSGFIRPRPQCIILRAESACGFARIKIPSNEDIPNFIQIPPEIQLRGIRADFHQVPSQKHLPALDLGAFFMEVFVDWCFVPGISRVECPGGDVGFQELLIDDIHDGGDQGFDILRA